jgi:hypothetical protein
MNSPSGAPECFGQLWSDKASECSGGYDPAYVGPGGGKVRPQCNFYDPCKTRVLLKKAAEKPSLIPPQSLIRQGPFAPATPYQHHGLIPGRPAIPQTAQPPQPTWYPQVQMRPIEMIPANYHMPAYLSEPEVRLEGESYWAPFAREVARGVGKAIGHSVAHFFDHMPFTRREQK